VCAVARVTGSGRPGETSGMGAGAYRCDLLPRQLPTRLQHGVVKHLFSKLDSFVWRRVAVWLRKRHHGLSWAALRKRFMRRWDITCGGIVLLMPSRTAVTRYRYRGTAIPTPWTHLLSTS
jgi:hypothetical protein